MYDLVAACNREAQYPLREFIERTCGHRKNDPYTWHEGEEIDLPSPQFFDTGWVYRPALSIRDLFPPVPYDGPPIEGDGPVKILDK